MGTDTRQLCVSERAHFAPRHHGLKGELVDCAFAFGHAEQHPRRGELLVHRFRWQCSSSVGCLRRCFLGRFFGALHTGARPWCRVHGDMPPTVSCIGRDFWFLTYHVKHTSEPQLAQPTADLPDDGSVSVKRSGQPGRHDPCIPTIPGRILGFQRQSGGKGCTPQSPQHSGGEVRACLPFSSPWSWLSSPLLGRLEPAPGGNRRSFFWLVSPAEGASAPALARGVDQLHACMRLDKTRACERNVRTTTTTPGLNRCVTDDERVWRATTGWWCRTATVRAAAAFVVATRTADPGPGRCSTSQYEAERCSHGDRRPPPGSGRVALRPAGPDAPASGGAARCPAGAWAAEERPHCAELRGETLLLWLAGPGSSVGRGH